MASLKIHNTSGEEAGTYEIAPEDLAPAINKQLLHDAVVMYEANRRQGTSKTKSRAELSFSTRKLYRQKGTGNARAGARSSGIRRGGGHIFAKRPRQHGYRLPRKSLQLATRMALAGKLQDDEITVLDEFSFEEPSTKAMAEILRALDLSDSLLVVTAGYDPLVYKSARNIPGVTVSPETDLNALVVLSSARLLITKAALDRIKQRAAGPAPQTA